ncbi:LD-carboxypeptidase [Ensifer sp. MPMI2T]|nr:LD-carboxypeptidase [Ensifer sp. MPMI2T]
MELLPPKLQVGDTVRFVSPASTPDRDRVFQAAEVLESWGLKVEFGENAFRKYAYLAGTDDERLADFNAALRDPSVRVVIATRGGKGSYRIADQLDFDAAKRDPKFVVGFSDISILHFSLWKHCQLIGVHGALYADDEGRIAEETKSSLRRVLMFSESIVIPSREDEPTSGLTTEGTASGRLIGGNLDMIATAVRCRLSRVPKKLRRSISLTENPAENPKPEQPEQKEQPARERRPEAARRVRKQNARLERREAKVLSARNRLAPATREQHCGCGVRLCRRRWCRFRDRGER